MVLIVGVVVISNGCNKEEQNAQKTNAAIKPPLSGKAPESRRILAAFSSERGGFPLGSCLCTLHIEGEVDRSAYEGEGHAAGIIVI